MPDDTGDTLKARVPALVGLLLALFFGLASVGHWIAPGDGMGARLARELVDWAEAIGILLWLVYVERLPLSSIGFRRPTWRSLVWAIAVTVALVLVMIVHFTVIIPAIGGDANVAGHVRDQILAQPLWYRLLLVLRAAVYEEILFRGYLIEKIRQLTGSWIAACVVSVATFTYAHLAGWGALHLIPVAAGGIIFAALYAARRDLPSNMLAHFLTDGIGLLFG